MLDFNAGVVKMSVLGNRIKAQRELLDMTQEELAQKLGYKSRSTVNKIEMGINDIPQSKIPKFAKALNCSIAYLMGWSDEEKPATQNGGGLRGVQLQLFNLLLSLTPDESDLVFGIVQEIVKSRKA